MRVKLLGTAASEGIPAIFCDCDVCRKAAEIGGKEIRRRSGTLVDGDMLIEYGPDLFAHKLNFKLRLDKVKHIVISHAHTDHFVPTELEMPTMPVLCKRDEGIIRLYGNEKVASAYYNTNMPKSGQFEFVLLKEGVSVKAGDKVITPLKAEHDSGQNCFVFVIEKGEKMFFYGHDSGVYSEKTFNALKEKKIGLAVLDCVAALNESYYNHMGLPDNVLVRKRMLSDGSADAATRFVITHFSHASGSLHEEIEAAAAPLGFITAYDGIEFDL